MNKLLFLPVIALLAVSCGGSDNSKPAAATTEQAPAANGNPSYDPKRGEGKFKDVDISPTLDVAKATAGEKVYSVKCGSCHKLTEEKLVGPGWKDVTKRRTAAWIMNFATNTEEMLSKDPEAQAMLEICLVRMPNQNLSDQEARDVYEFMRKNDGIK